jgi:type II secretory pathway component GspD/PulD (secretin)
MQNIAALMTLAALSAGSALAQPTDRLLHFTATASAQDFQEIATVIQATTDITQASVDATEKSLSLHGTTSQIALAEWLFTNLDKPTSIRLDPQGAKHEYRVSDSADDVVRLFYLTNPAIPNGVQEMATAVRSLANIRQMFTYNDLRAVVVRGTSDQINAAEFLFAEMDKPAQQLQSAPSSEFRMNEPPFNLVRVFYLPNTKTIRDFQEVATLVRSTADLRYLFTYNAARAVAIRGTGDQIALAKWLLEDLGKASIPESAKDYATHEYRLSPTSDDFVRVFYLPHATTPDHLLETAAEVRQKLIIRRAFTYSVPNALVIRDTAQKISQAEKLIQQQVQ